MTRTMGYDELAAVYRVKSLDPSGRRFYYGPYQHRSAAQAVLNKSAKQWPENTYALEASIGWEEINA